MTKLCYIIFTHGGLSILEKQIELLSGNNISFFLHIDKKCSELLSPSLTQNGSVVLSKQRFDIEWGDFSMVDAIITISQEALNKLPDSDYFIFLSGQCMPVKNPEYIKSYLTSHHNSNFLKANPIPSIECSWLEGGRRRLECYAIRLNTRNISTIEPRKLDFGNLRQIGKTLLKGNMISIWKMLNVLLFAKKRAPLKLKPYGGEFWWRMNRGSLETVISYFQKNTDFQDQMKITSNPDEIAINTICFNLCNDISNSLLTYINWKGNSNSPDWITMSDKQLIDAIINNPDILFCRKIKDWDVLSYIQKQLYSNEVFGFDVGLS